MNKVSVIMPVYNASEFLVASVESVLAQSYPAWELILVDDCSGDSSYSICQRFAEMDKRIVCHQLPVNSGVAAARNKGIESATGHFIAFLDSDDVWLPKKLESQIAFLVKNNVAITYSSYYVINHSGETIAVYEAPAVLTYQKLLKSNFIGNLTGVYDVRKFGKRFMSKHHHEDYIFWLGLLKEVPEARGLKIKLAKYRKTNNSVSANKFKAIQWQWSIYTRIERLGYLKSFYYILFYIYFGLTKYKKIKAK